MAWDEIQTIAAIATAHGRGGVAVIRVSGPDAFAIAERVTGRLPAVGRIGHVRFYENGGAVLIDDGIMLAFGAPRSYTGEDVIEFQCHGGVVTPRRVLEACFAAGARLARRGEFTQRAFLNGKLDYDQAESVLALIDAKTVRAADAALAGLSGRRMQELRAFYETALGISTDLEHALDISEEELPLDFERSVRARIDELIAGIEHAIRTAGEGRMLRDGALVVLAGPPNAGKSSLMNALLDENRAIVSDVPGTTRDSIEEWMDLDGWPVRLVDTAGLRDTADEIEAEGVRRSGELIADADVVVALLAADAPDHAAMELPADAIAVTSKCDLGRGAGLNVSVKTGEGLAELKTAICARLAARVESAVAESDLTIGAADGSALHEVLAVLRSVRSASDGAPFDLLLAGNAMRSASERLGTQIGAVYSSDLLDKLFSRFCVGK